MKILVTGGAGFIGRWVVKKLLDDGHSVVALDNLFNGKKENIKEFIPQNNSFEFIKGDIKDKGLLQEIFLAKFDLCYHLAASINVQDSIDNPRKTFNNDAIGTFNILEQCKKNNVKVVFMSTCMVYDRALSDSGIKETDTIKPLSPYAGAKIAGENMALSYYYTYGLPVVVIRPFNTYGPFQKSSGEGGVVSIFIKNKLEDKRLNIYGDGTQTRDLLYVEDCARFIVSAGYSNDVNGEILNAGLGNDISINKLAKIIVEDESKIKHVPHIHPQSEIPKLLCDYQKAKNLLNWEPEVSLKEGLKLTEEWIKSVNIF